MKTFVIIPAYNEAQFIEKVISKIGDEVSKIIVVDDFSSDQTASIVSSIKDQRIQVVRHNTNTGVGGAMVTGYKIALKERADIVVKIDGDGQMNPTLIPRLIAPIKQKKADYTKGTRFRNSDNIRQMPKTRLVGNLALSFLTKAASGYWNIFDPTSGFTAIHRSVLNRINLDKLSQKYFFETDMLTRLYRIQAVVRDVDISTTYGNETSELSPYNAAVTFPFLLTKSFIQRFAWRYFITDFTAVSLFTLLGLPLFSFGILFGLYHWIQNVNQNISTETGTIMIAVISLFFGFQFLLQAAVLDISNIPQTPVQSLDS